MQKTIRRRSASIKQVLGQPQNNASIRTASESTLQRLREERAVLRNTLEVHQQELDQLRRSDRIMVAAELKIAIPLVYAEMTRLIRQTDDVKRLEAMVRAEQDRLQAQIASIPMNEQVIDDYQFEIDDLTEKLFAYRLAATPRGPREL
jgi:hypothetical protein